MNSFSFLSSLSAEEKQFLKTKQIIGERVPDEWLAFFKKLTVFDAQSDKTRSRGGWLGCLGIILVIVSFFLMTVVIGFFMLPIGFLLAVGGLVAYFYLKPYNIESEILAKTVSPMLLILREEMKPSGKLKLRLDLRGFAMPEKLVNKTPSYKKGAYHAIIDSFYRDHWIDGETQLGDDTRLLWSIENYVKSSSKSKRNARGKHKTKTKNKYRSLISMQIGMNNKKYSLPEKVKYKGAEGAIRTKDADKYSWMSIRKMVKYSTGQTFDPNDFVTVIATAYARAIPSGGKK